MSSNTSIIIAREYMERVRKKSFIITTLLMPILMIGLGAVPTLIMVFTGPERSKVNVVDDSGAFAPFFVTENPDAEITFVMVGKQSEVPVDEVIKDETVDATVVIPADIVSSSNAVVKIYSREGLAMSTESAISSIIDKGVETLRLKEYNIENLDEILADVQADVTMQTIRVSQEGEEQAASSTISMLMGYLLSFILYISLVLYGQMVMTSIIEEKNNRVLELVVSSVKPTRLMMGKILGIGLVALTQIVIWLILVVGISAFLIPAMLPADLLGEATAFNSGSLDATAATADIELLQVIGILADPWYLFTLFIYLMLFLIGGFLLYAGIYAAIGSAVDNIQDASQLQSVVIFPVIIGLIFGVTAAATPNSLLSVITSFIPLTSPMVMLARIPFGIPTWQIWLSLALLVGGIAFTIWLAAKIYRVGIFMYGKKPSLKELIRWARYK